MVTMPACHGGKKAVPSHNKHNTNSNDNNFYLLIILYIYLDCNKTRELFTLDVDVAETGRPIFVLCGNVTAACDATGL
ncbi:hypothetical protein [Zobellella endophytica]|uniref:hypothetical protein n=1 Tax=Zobellella endophytica TaxID=2116700 RepID=UPI0011B2578C|nr:hypothetical protein [Zobellella endophytica]